MEFLQKQEFQHLHAAEQQYIDNYEGESNCVAKYALLLPTIQYLISTNQQLDAQANKQEGLSVQNLKQIRLQDSSAFLSKIFCQKYKQAVAKMKQGQKLSNTEIFNLVFEIFKVEILQSILLSISEGVCRIAFSIIILYLFQAFSDNNLKIAIVYTSILAILQYIGRICKQNCADIISSVTWQMKSGLGMLLFAKVSNLTSFTIKNAELGKITNLLANDFGAIQQRTMFILHALVLPIYLLGIIVMLCIRIGWSSIVGIVVIILAMFLIVKVSKQNGLVLNQINKYKDKRVQTTSEIIEGVKYVKLYGWELTFKNIVQTLRMSQISQLKKIALGRSLQRSISCSMGFFGAYVLFVVAYYTNANLTTSKIFSILQCFLTLKVCLAVFMIGISVYIQFKVLLERFANVFNLQNRQMIRIDEANKIAIGQQNKGPDYSSESLAKLELQVINQEKKNELKQDQKAAVLFYDFNGYWNQNFESPSLKNVNLQFFAGSLYGITGKVGSGKSGLLCAILGEIPYYSGKLQLNGSLAYVQQQPIIFSDTVRNNITFGRHFDQPKYESAVRLSCLASDFEILAEGDSTIVGERGVTLSGGQKARLSLARALYFDADVYLLDDPISAVDSKVAKEIFEKCLKPLSKVKTVILVTHQIGCLYDCDQVIVLQEGRVCAKGKPQQLKAKLKELSHSLSNSGQQKQENGKQQLDPVEQNQNKNSLMHGDQKAQKQAVNQQIQIVGSNRFEQKNVNLSWATYWNFFTADKRNYLAFPLMIILSFICEIFLALFFRFLADYNNVILGHPSSFVQNEKQYWGILAVWITMYLVTMWIKYICLNFCILNSSESIHQTMIEAILRSPASFFDCTPSGILINKFSNDLGVIDSSLITVMYQFFEGPIAFLVILVNICQINLYLIPACVLFLVSVIGFAAYCRPALIASRQLNLKSKTPIFHFFSEATNALTQIRIYRRRKELISDFSQIMNKATKSFIGYDMISRAFGFYSTLFAILMFYVGTIIIIQTLNYESIGLFCVTVVYLVPLTEYFQWIIKQMIISQSLMVSAERLLQFSGLPQEKQLRNEYDRSIGLSQQFEAHLKNEDLHQQWPQSAEIQIRNLSAKYREELPFVLNGVTLNIKQSQKIGIVGRTGAGKSSIIQALFRIFESELGSVYRIGGYDALQMGLHSLRQHISIIPQTPFLFKGSVRLNIDPFHTANEEQLWRVLEEAGLSEHVRSLHSGLDTDISNASESFSVGQKQLLCLARALLRRNKFLVLDEATSNVDMKTDDFIQRVIRERFKDTTVITIAHRLSTVADYNLIIVMQRGRVVEEGAPHELVQKKGMFWEMVQHTGKNSSLIMDRIEESKNKRMRC